MSTNHLYIEDAKNMLEKASVLFEVNEYSEGLKCDINAIYYQLDDYHFIEHVTKKYSDSKKIESGYFFYDSPAPIILAMIHSEDVKIKIKAEEFFRNYMKDSDTITLSLPKGIKEKIDSLAERFCCSLDLMITNLISQGLSSEMEMNSYYDKNERRVLSDK